MNRELKDALQAVQRAICVALAEPDPLDPVMRVPADAEEFRGNRLAWLLNRYGEAVMGEEWMPYEAWDVLPEDEAEELLILLGGEPDGAYVVLDADGTYRASLYEATVYSAQSMGGKFSTYEDVMDALMEDIRDLKTHAPYMNTRIPVWFVSFIPGNEIRLKIMKGI